MHIINSSNNPIIKLLNQLNNNHFRQKHKQTLLEGSNLVSAWSSSIYKNKIECLIISENGLTNSSFNKFFTQFKIYVINKQLWQQITNLPDNDILAVIRFETKIFDINLNSCGVILDNIQDSGNMGNIIRTAASASYDWLLAIGGASIYSPKVLRSSMGGHVCINLYQTTDNKLSFIQDKLKQANILLTSLDKSKGNNIYSINLPKYHIWIIGNEGAGIHCSWLDLANITLVNIPQNSKIDSLNAASAASICLYEKVRQNFIFN